MQALLDFFKSIGNTIVSVVQFLIGIVEDIVYVVKITGAALAQIPSFFSWIPAEMLVIILAIFAVIVVYKILGREG